MFDFKKWLGPIPVIVLITFIIAGGSNVLPQIEAGILKDAKKRIADIGQSWATVNVEGQRLQLNGTAPTQEIQDYVKSVIVGIPGVIDVADATKIAPPEKPYVIQISKKQQVILIEGAVPTRAVKDQVLEDLRSVVPTAQIKDTTHFAYGVGDPVSWFKGIHYSIAQLARLEEGKIKLSDGLLDIEGITASAEKYDVLKTALKVLPETIRLNKDLVAVAQPDNYEFTLNRVGTVVTVSGFVPSEDVRADAAKAVQDSIVGASIVDQLRIAVGAPQAFDLIIKSGIAALAQTNTGTFEYSKNIITFKAMPDTLDQFNAATAALNSVVPLGVKLDATQLVAPSKTIAPLVLQWDGKTLVLTGELPDASIKEFIERQLQLTTSAALQDQTLVRSVLPKFDYYASLRPVIQSLNWSKSLKATVDESGITVQGEAVDAISYDIAQQYFAQSLPVKVQKFTFQAPVLQPYLWIVQKDGAVVEITGYVPSKDLRSKLIEQARATAKTPSIIDTMHFASTVLSETDWSNAAQFALDLSKLMKKSTVTLNDLTLTVTGQAASADDYLAAKSLLAKLPQGVTTKTIAIEPPASAQFFWKLEKAKDAVLLSGAVRHDYDNNELKKSISAAGLTDQIQGNWGVEGGAPHNFQELAKLSIKSLSHLSDAQIEIRSNVVHVTGEANSPLAEARMKKNYNALLSTKDGMKLVWDVKIGQFTQTSATECEHKIRTLIKNSNGAFSGFDIQVSAQFQPVLVQIADTLAQCPQSTFDIIAAASLQGGSEFNADIAKRRARAIAVDLVREGIGQNRLRVMPVELVTQHGDAESLNFVAQHQSL